MRRFVHDFLKWFPVTLIGGCFAAAQLWQPVKDWIATQAVCVWHEMTLPWGTLMLLVSVAAYVVAIIWTGQERATNAISLKPQPFPNMPLYKVCRYIARDSMWASRYAGSDYEWITNLDRELQSKLSLGRISAFAIPPCVR